MEKIDEEARARFLEEAGIRLKGEGFQVGPAEEGYMPVSWQGAPLCRVNGVGGVRYRDEALKRPGASEALDRVVDVTVTIAEYMRLVEKAPALKAEGLDESYKLLAEFNDTVLAAHRYPNNQGWLFITWKRDSQGTGVHSGHYAAHHYKDAKEDFAIRAGLVPQSQMFSQEQLAEIHRCVDTVRDMDLPMTAEREQRMEEILDQIKCAVPDLDARIGQAQNMDGQIADQAFGSQMM